MGKHQYDSKGDYPLRWALIIIAIVFGWGIVKGFAFILYEGYGIARLWGIGLFVLVVILIVRYFVRADRWVDRTNEYEHPTARAIDETTIEITGNVDRLSRSYNISSIESIESTGIKKSLIHINPSIFNDHLAEDIADDINSLSGYL